MATFAIDHCMLTNQLKISIVVVKFYISGINFPTIGSMTLGTIDPEGFPVR
jgi:hypothetical protein